MSLDFQTINAYALAAYPGILYEWLPGGKLNGTEYECGDLTGGRGDSLRVNTRTGVWSDFAAAGVGGSDPISLFAAIRHVGQGEAAKDLADRFSVGTAPPPPSPTAKQKWMPIVPVPDDAPRPPDEFSKKNDNGDWQKLPLVTRWTYRDQFGQTIGHVARFAKPGGGKEIVPQTFCAPGGSGGSAGPTGSGSPKWRWLSFPQPRPLYGLDRLAAAPNATVIVVEGEKCADALHNAIVAAGWTSFVVVSWPGGGKATKYVDWSPLAGRKLVLWPDFDAKPYEGTTSLKIPAKQPGMMAMLDIANRTKKTAAGIRILNYTPGEKPDGWDVADAIDEGWNAQACLEFIKARMVGPEDVAVRPPEQSAQPATDSQAQHSDVPIGDEPPVQDVADADYSRPDSPDARPDRPDARPDTADARPDPAEPLPAPGEMWSVENGPFQILGYDHGAYFYLPRGTGQVVELTPSSHSKQNLLALAPRSWWEKRFPGESCPVSWDLAANAMLRACERRGVYDPGRIRGRGAWEDDGRSVLHLGDRLLVDGRSVSVEDISSRFIYESGIPMEHGVDAAPLSTQEANRFAALCDMPTWESGISGRLLAGWCVVAPICGALSWRPHIWCTGSAGSGKSWVMDNILRPAIGPAALCVQSNTTEAGLRQILKYDARPVLFDEAEGEDNESRMRIQRVLELMRQASSETGAVIVKGSSGGRAQTFRIRSMFAFSSIGVGATQKADNSRLTVLSLVKDESPDRVEKFEFLKKTRHDLLTPEYLSGLRARTIRLVPVIRRNAETFARAAAVILGSQRAGDQVGALLAGAYSLYSAAEISPTDAAAWVGQQDWGRTTDDDDGTDEARCLSAILEAVIRVDTGRFCTEMAVGEAISGGRSASDSGPSRADIDKALGRVGIKRETDQCLTIANAHSGIAKILRDTPWAKNWRRILLRLPGAIKTGPVRFAGTTCRGVSVMIPDDGFC